jgi:acetoin utilization deacetylase AcuC-like enzyme
VQAFGRNLSEETHTSQGYNCGSIDIGVLRKYETVGIKIAFHPIYEYPLPIGHRFPMDKYGLIKQQIIYEGVFDESCFFAPEAMKEEDILITHSENYWQKLIHQQLSEKEIRKIGFPMSPLLVERGRHIAMGTYRCCLYAMEAGISLNVAGGTHHSYRDHGEGFCLFNDLAIAANMLLTTHGLDKILIVDLDVHQGNGTASIFKDELRVFTFSIHGEKNYPIRKEKSDLDIALPDGANDITYLSVLEENLKAIIQNFKPQFILYQAGVDVLKKDKLGRLGLSHDGCKKRDEMVMQMAKCHQVPIAVTMGGGYSPQIKDILNAHTNTFKAAKDIFE